jgi:hypothetical protein
MAEASGKTCGDCAFWKTPKCNYSGDQAILRKDDATCSEFYERLRGKEKPKKKQLKDSGITTDGCFEAIYHNEKPSFLVKSGECFSVAESLEIQGQVFYPKEAKSIPYEAYGFFEGNVPERENLFWKVRTEFDTWIDVEPIWKDVLAACVMLTYHQDKLRTVPYIFLYGDNESGKSTVLQVLKALCYRPLCGVTIPSADLYGYLEDADGAGCILEDEVQGIIKDIDKVKIYKAGYKAGAVVPRTLITQNDRIIKYYRTFCFKACASEQIPQVKGFNERFLFISMVEGFPTKEWADLSHEDIERLRNSRNVLLKWRMAAREWELPEIQTPFKGRLKELWKPILQISHGLTIYDTLFNFVKNQENERLSGKQNTLEGHIVKVVVDLYNQAKDLDPCIPFQTIWTELGHDLDGKLDDKKPHVMDTSEFFQVTKNKIGYRLREILSGESKVLREKDSDGNWISTKAYAFNIAKLKRVARKYGQELVTKLPSLLSSEGVFRPEAVEKTMKNGEKSPKSMGKEEEKHIDAPPEVGKLSNLATSEKESLELSSSNTSKEVSAGGESSQNSVSGLIPCPYCKARGKPMSFVSDHDLKCHVASCHEPEEPEDYVR